MARYGSTGSLSRMQQMINKVNKRKNDPPTDPPNSTYTTAHASYKNIQAAIDHANRQQHEQVLKKGSLRKQTSGFKLTNPDYKEYQENVLPTSVKVKNLTAEQRLNQSARVNPEELEEMFSTWENNPAININKEYKKYTSGGEDFYSPQIGLSNVPDLPQLWNVSKDTKSVPELKPLTAAKRKKRVSNNPNKARYMKQKKLASKYKKQQFVYEDRGDWREAKRAKRKGEEDAITSGRYAKHEDKVTYYKDGQVDTKLQGYDQARAEEIYQGRLEHDAKKMEEYKNQYVKWDTARVGLGLQSQPYEDFIAKQKLKTP